MTVKHTPGPWEVELIVGLPRVISDSRKSTCRVIADLHIQEGVGAISNGKNPELVAEIAANAQLIAAAPEMLAALNAICAGFADGSIRFTRKRQSDSDPHHPANILMCAAIAKAEGR